MTNNIYNFPSGGGSSSTTGSGGGLEARIAKLESDVGHIQSDVKEIKMDIRELRKDGKNDFRILFSAIIFVALGLAALMAKSFGWIK
jgi:hypothetical protein